MEAIWRRLHDVNVELPEELVVLMTLTGLPPSFETQTRSLESQKDLSVELIQKELSEQKALVKNCPMLKAA